MIKILKVKSLRMRAFLAAILIVLGGKQTFSSTNSGSVTEGRPVNQLTKHRLTEKKFIHFVL
jgi:hypothetical protein